MSLDRKYLNTNANNTKKRVDDNFKVNQNSLAIMIKSDAFNFRKDELQQYKNLFVKISRDVKKDDKFDFYKNIFKYDKVVNLSGGGVSYEKLCEFYPQRMEIKKLNTIFKDFIKVAGPIIINQNSKQYENIKYVTENLRYKGCVRKKPETDNNSNKTEVITLSIANDGFLYKSIHDQDVEAEGTDLIKFQIHDHRGLDGYFMLKGNSISDYGCIIDEVSKLFKIANNEISYNVFYNFTRERIDIVCKFIDSSIGNIKLRINFEPGYPIHQIVDDLWTIHKINS